MVLTHKERKERRSTKNPLYRAWHNMIERCEKSDRKDSRWYHDRGIKVCIEWKDFNQFVYDMSPSFQKGLWLDRIDPDKGYSLENCRWTTPYVQQINRRVRETNPTQNKGVFLRKENGKFRTGIMINEKWKWLGTFETLEEAINIRKTAEKEHYSGA